MFSAFNVYVYIYLTALTSVAGFIMYTIPLGTHKKAISLRTCRESNEKKSQTSSDPTELGPVLLILLFYVGMCRRHLHSTHCILGNFRDIK